MEQTIVPLLLGFGGLMGLYGGLTAPAWFMNHRKVAALVSLFGAWPVRVFYTALGAVLLCVAVGAGTGMIDLGRRGRPPHPAASTR